MLCCECEALLIFFDIEFFINFVEYRESLIFGLLQYICSFLTMEFQQLSKMKCSLVASLSQKKMRVKHGFFCVEGHKSVRDTLGKFKLAFIVATDKWLETESETAMKEYAISGNDIYHVGESAMRTLTAFSTPSDVIAVFKLPAGGHDSDTDIPHLEKGLYLLLDGIQDPGNLGTIIRTAHWFGIRRIFASHTTVDVFNPKTIQSAMGSMGSVEVIYTDLEALADVNRQIPLTGLMLDGDDIFRTELPESALIVMGNEGNGVTPGMRRRLCRALTIPPSDKTFHPESLNVAVATAITLSAFAGR